MAKVLAHLTLSDEPFEINEDEIGNLKAQGLFLGLADSKPKPAAPAAPVVPAPAPAPK